MKTFRDIYKFPLVELGFSIGRVYDSDNNFVFQFHIESKSTREKLLKCINGEINLTIKFQRKPTHFSRWMNLVNFKINIFVYVVTI